MCFCDLSHTVIYPQLPGVYMHLVTDDTLLEMQFPEESDIANCSESASLFVPGFTRNKMTSLNVYLVKVTSPWPQN